MPKNSLKHLVFTVTTDLTYDQRMQRICGSLQKNGYEVLLIGRKKKNSVPIENFSYQQRRIKCFFNQGKLFYAEYNLRLFFYLMSIKFDLICSIDLDTILPCYYISLLRNKKRVFDAHELFCEMKEVVTRKDVFTFWKKIEKNFLPKFPNGYTVSKAITNIFEKEYGLKYEVIMNTPYFEEYSKVQKQSFIIYQGSVNEGRSLETLIPAFQNIPLPLFIYGTGNFFFATKKLIAEYSLQEKIILKGSILPDELKKITPQAILGINILEQSGLNNYYSLSNRFFDFMHAGIPQICIDFPSYKAINDGFQVAILINDLSPENIAKSINDLLHNQPLMEKISQNAREAAKIFCWQEEEKKLLTFYEKVFTQ